MRVILQQIATEMYFQGAGEWTIDPDKAHNFGSSLKAIDYCLAQKLTGVEVVLKFTEAQYDIHLSVTGNRKKPPPDERWQ
jgi:hypothetical protein